MPPLEMMERVSVVESARQGISEDDRLAILKMSTDPERHQKVKEIMLAMMGAGVGVLSLTEKPDNLLMWAHYAAEHTGYVIGFDTTQKYWNNFGDERGNSHVGVLRKVDYSEHRPAPAHLAAVSLVEMYFTKSHEWEYEQEWRVFRNVQEADHFIELEGDLPICLFNVPKDSVRQVIIGCRAPEEFQDSIIEIMKTTPEFATTEVLNAAIDDAEFKLNFGRIWPVDKA